jgi:hexosaminidase
LFLMIGVNDLNQGLPVAKTLANYSRLFDDFAARLPGTRIYVQSVLPINDQWRWGADNAGIAQLNAFLQAESARRRYTWIDLNTDFRDRDGKLRAELSNDGIHLLGAGYRLWRDRVRVRVEE